MTFPIGCDPRDFPATHDDDLMCPGCRGAGCRACGWSGVLTPEQIRDRRDAERAWRNERNANHERRN